jgi:hypothetical protein
MHKADDRPLAVLFRPYAAARLLWAGDSEEGFAPAGFLVPPASPNSLSCPPTPFGDGMRAYLHKEAVMTVISSLKSRIDSRDRREGRRLRTRHSTSSAAARVWLRYGGALSRAHPGQQIHTPAEYKDFDFSLLAAAPSRRCAEPDLPTGREYRKMRQRADQELKLMSIRTLASQIADGRFARLSRKDAAIAVRQTGRSGRRMFVHSGVLSGQAGTQ